MTCYIYLSRKSLMSFNYLLAVIILPIQVLCRGKVNSIRMAGGRKPRGAQQFVALLVVFCGRWIISYTF